MASCASVFIPNFFSSMVGGQNPVKELCRQLKPMNSLTQVQGRIHSANNDWSGFGTEYWRLPALGLCLDDRLSCNVTGRMNSPLQSCHKVNRRQARQGEMRSKRGSPGGSARNAFMLDGEVEVTITFGTDGVTLTITPTPY